MSDKAIQEKAISSDVIYDGKLLHLQLRTVELSDGTHVKREIIVHPGAVAMVPVLDDGRIMLIRQYRTAAEGVLYEIPAGTLEPDEALEAAAARELREEIGYRPGKLQKLGGIHVAPGYTTEYIHIYLATALTKAPLVADSDEQIAPHPVTLAEAVAMVVEGKVSDAKTITGILLAEKVLR